MTISHHCPFMVFDNDMTTWIRTECSYFRTNGCIIDKLTFIQVLINFIHYNITCFYTYTNINLIIIHLNTMLTKDMIKPGCAITTRGEQDILCIKLLTLLKFNTNDFIFFDNNIFDNCLKTHIDMLFEFFTHFRHNS